MILHVTQVFVMQFANDEALQSEVVEPRHHLFGTRAFLHRHGLQPDGTPSHPFEVSVQLCRIHRNFLDVVFSVLARARILLLRIFFSFFFFLFVRKGCGGNIAFSFSFFLFLQSGFVGGLLVVCWWFTGGGRVVMSIFTERYDGIFVGGLLVDYAFIFHLTKDCSEAVSIDVKPLCALVHAQPHHPLLVGLGQQVDEQLQPSCVFEDPRGEDFAVEVNVVAHFQSFNVSMFPLDLWSLDTSRTFQYSHASFNLTRLMSAAATKINLSCIL